MSGHSKWATTKHQKGAKDAARAKVFAKIIRQVEVAAREGGSDMTANASLRTMYTKARDASVPIDTIERAIKRGSGELEGVRYESISYEGYAPAGVAVIVECLSDNRNRTGSPRSGTCSTRTAGRMAEPGAVSWQFERKGVIAVPKSFDEDQVLEVAMEAGAEDLSDDGEQWTGHLCARRPGGRPRRAGGGGAEPGRVGADHGAHLDRRGRIRVRGQAGAPAHRGPRRPRRRAERLLQLRHPRRGDGRLRRLTRNATRSPGHRSRAIPPPSARAR